MEVNVHEAKTHLSRLLRRVAEGEEITISRAGIPVAKMTAVVPAHEDRTLGGLEGQIYIAEDFDAPLPNDLLAQFYGEKPRSKKRGTSKDPKAGKQTRR